MPKPLPVLLAILVLSALLLAGCRPASQTPLTPATGAPVTQPAYPPPTTPTQAESPTPNIEPSTTGQPPASPQASEPYPAPGSAGTKATPVADSPAAGVCDLQEGDQVTFEINPDIPSPRCAQALPQQHLHVINRTDSDLEVSIAGFHATLAPDQDIVLEVPLGDYLLPGVHRVVTSAYGGGGGPELWLLEEVPTGTPGYPPP